MLDVLKARLEVRKLLLKAGAIADATIIGASSSTKNATQTRDPEIIWYFGMKVSVGTDRHGVIHTVTTTDAESADYKLQWQLSSYLNLVNQNGERSPHEFAPWSIVRFKSSSADGALLGCVTARWQRSANLYRMRYKLRS
ncbi:MAG: hypothetical protein IBJ03_13735 [Gemmatimonadaceae bacterium]|nr:hypothetical protein [Gemmatimonadaceae bacterium]